MTVRNPVHLDNLLTFVIHYLFVLGLMSLQTFIIHVHKVFGTHSLINPHIRLLS